MNKNESTLKTMKQPSAPPEEVVIPVLEEIASVEKHAVDTGRGIRATKTVVEREEVITEPLVHDELTIQRVPIHRILGENEKLPSTQQVGNVTIIPVLEERFVKQVMLLEEVRITKTQKVTHEPQTVSLRSEKVVTERFSDDN